jgi:rhodanese-related sulfurtransferase
MSLEMLKLDLNLLDESTLGLFMEDSSMSEEIKQTINNLAHAAMQNQKIELSDVLKVIKQDSIQEAEEALLTSEELREKRLQETEEATRKHELEKLDKMEQNAQAEHEREKEIVVLKESERRKTVIQAQTILSLGFNEDKDVDGDGIVDVMEVAKDGINAQLAISKERREDRKTEHDMQMDKERNKLEEKKITAMNNKPTNK